MLDSVYTFIYWIFILNFMPRFYFILFSTSASSKRITVKVQLFFKSSLIVKNLDPSTPHLFTGVAIKIAPSIAWSTTPVSMC